VDALTDWLKDSIEPNLILAGDFNFPEIAWNHITNKSMRPIARDFQELHVVTTHGLTQIVDCPTHDKGNTLDLLLTNLVPLPTLKSIDIKLSDHSALTFDISSLLPQPSNTKLALNKTPSVFSKAHWENTTEDMQLLKTL
jgi:endonuclease/exonuclease/phosphatase family metal-dependent hydrolase